MEKVLFGNSKGNNITLSTIDEGIAFYNTFGKWDVNFIFSSDWIQLGAIWDRDIDYNWIDFTFFRLFLEHLPPIEFSKGKKYKTRGFNKHSENNLHLAIFGFYFTIEVSHYED
jgi:hypothetical protein